MKLIDIIVKLLILYYLVLIFYAILSMIVFYRHVNDMDHCHVEHTIFGESEGLVCEE